MNFLRLHAYVSCIDEYESEVEDDDFSESGSDSSDEEDRQGSCNQNHDEPLCPGSPMTVYAFVIAFAAIILRHRITKVGAADILKLIAACLMKPHKCCTTYHQFQKYFSDGLIGFEKHYYCEKCQAPLNNSEHNVDTDESIEIDEVIDNDEYCDCDDSLETNYYLNIPIIPQLESLYDRKDFYNKLNTVPRYCPNGEYRDIYDGEVYKELSQQNQILSKQNNISFQWYTDGVRIFNSSKFSIWGFFLIILELPYALRYKMENVLLVSLWFGDKKPSPNLFLKPLKESLRSVYEGIQIYVRDLKSYIKVQGIIICGTADLPAKALFLSMNQYNGRFGCQVCLEPGQTVAKTRVYPYRKEITLRTDEETIRNSRLALEAKIAVCGVKGPSIISKIVPKYVTSTAIDIMHCLFAGVLKRLPQLWFDSQFAGEKFSFNDLVEVVDYRLCSIKPPCSVARRPTPIKTHFCHWKTAQFKEWSLYYSLAVLSDILPSDYFNHYMYVILGVHLLSQETITEQMINLADQCFEKFIADFENLYELKFMTCNLHLLRHLALMTRRFGPLFTTSCFPLENLNGVMKSMVRGSKAPHIQIVSNLSMHMAVYTHNDKWLEENEAAHKLCMQILSSTRKLKLTMIEEGIFIVGFLLKNQPEYMHEILVANNWMRKNVFAFSKLYKNHTLYTSKAVQNDNKTESFYVSYDLDNETKFGIIQNFVRVTDCRCKKICNCNGKHYAILKDILTENPFSTDLPGGTLSFYHRCIIISDTYTVIDVKKLSNVCYHIQIQNMNVDYLVEPVNNVENE